MKLTLLQPTTVWPVLPVQATCGVRATAPSYRSVQGTSVSVAGIGTSAAAMYGVEARKQRGHAFGDAANNPGIRSWSPPV